MRDSDMAQQLSSILHGSQNKSKNLNAMNDSELDELIATNPEIQSWKSLPKARRDRLTKKQLLKMYKENTMAESMQIQTKKQKLTKKVWVDQPNEDEDQEKEKAPVKPKQF